jgi:hypothetical protein
MEATTSAIEDVLVNSFDYKLKPSATYVTERRNCTFFSQGSNTYSPSGVRVLKFQLSSNGWLDPDSVRIMYTLVNEDPVANHYLRPVSGPWSLFRRLRITCGGVTVEDINEFDRISHMFSILSTDEYLGNSHVEGFGYEPYLDNMELLDGDITRGIPGGKSKVVCFKPLCGLFSQPKNLPLRYCNIVVELELVNTITDNIISDNGDTVSTAVISTAWRIENCQLKADILTLDNGLENSYASHLMSGNQIPVPMTTYISQSQTLAKQSEESIHVTRSMTRLKAMYLTFGGTSTLDTARLQYLKNCNNFYHPMANSSPEKELSYRIHVSRDANYTDANNFINKRKYIRTYNSDNELYYQIQIGSALYPQYECRSVSESWYHLASTLKHQNNNKAGLNIEADAYYNHTYIIGQNFEKVSGAEFTGINTRAGDLCTIKLKNMTPEANSANRPNKIFVTMLGTQIMNIGDTGIQVFD